MPLQAEQERTGQAHVQPDVDQQLAQLPQQETPALPDEIAFEQPDQGRGGEKTQARMDGNGLPNPEEQGQSQDGCSCIQVRPGDPKG
ncbi:MAG: hypothetical protein M0C28_30780 [Candidatus Moduliflexus flocculans]|nr:hypothetical protein [Candidatus Moduliflexus flocculans]